MKHTRYEKEHTWIDAEELAYNVPLQRSPRRAFVYCPDGRLRTARLGIPDTYFSIPARLSAHGRTITGYVTTTDDGADFEFRPYMYRRNHTVFSTGK